MIIKAIKDYISACSYLQEFEAAICAVVGSVASNSELYAIEVVKSEPILKKYMSGDTLRQCHFTFCSKESYGTDVLQSIESSSFYDDFENWIEQENNKGNLPSLTGNYIPVEIKVISSGYAFPVSQDKSRYQIELILNFYKKSGGK